MDQNRPLSTGEVARLLGVHPHQVAQIFYEGRLKDDRCPIVGGRRIIPSSYVEIIAMELRRKGILVRDADVDTARAKEPSS